MNLRLIIVPQFTKCGEFLFSKRNFIKFMLTDSFHKCSVKPTLKSRKFEFFNGTKRLSNITFPVESQSQPVVLKKRIAKKKKFLEIENSHGFRIQAFSTAEEYDLESLLDFLPKATKYIPTKFGADFFNVTDVVHAVDKPVIASDSQHLFFFREGTVVFWNVPELEIRNVLKFLKEFEEKSFDADIVVEEREDMSYSYLSDTSKTVITKDTILFSESGDLTLEKYAVSNAMALSVQLGAYEAKLDQYIQNIKPVTEDLRMGRKIKMTREEVLRKTGEMFALRHQINLNSDLLDTPDFYWDREDLENLYQATFNYFCVNKRTRVMNEKINHCIELVELLSSHLSDKHHVRLEWMIIILIMVEVAFEMFHYIERSIDHEQHESDINRFS